MDQKIKDFRWWEEKDDTKASRKARDAAEAARSTSQEALDQQHLHLYSEREWRLRGMGQGGRKAAEALARELNQPGVSLNLIRNGVNASVSMLAGGSPLPMYLTDGADWYLQKRARKRNRFLHALYNRQQVHIKQQSKAQQAGIFGTGYLHIIRTKAGPIIEEVFTPELLVDQFEGIYRQPQNMARVRSMDRLQAQMLWPKRAKDIEKAQRVEDRTGGSNDRIRIYQTWHMASEPGSDDGEYGVVLDSDKPCDMLERHKYKWCNPPFSRFSWQDEPIGWHGTGIAAEGKNIQFELNMLLYLVSKNIYSGGNLKVFVEKGSKVNLDHINNSLNAPIIEYVGQPPTFTTPRTIDSAVTQHIQYLEQSFYQTIGISQFNAQSQTPFASMSGKARLVHNQSENRRFLATQKRFDQSMTLDLAQRIMEACEDVKDFWGDFEIVFAGRRAVEAIKFSDIVGDDDYYDLQCFSTSGLASSPAARLEEVEAYIQAGYYTREEGRVLMQLPDTGSAEAGPQRAYELVMDRIQRIVDDNDYLGPTPSMPLQLALQKSSEALMLAELMEQNPDEDRRIPPENVESLRLWRDTVVSLLQKEEPPPPPPVDPMAAGGPMGAGDPGMLGAPPAMGAMG